MCVCACLSVGDPDRAAFTHIDETESGQGGRVKRRRAGKGGRGVWLEKGASG